MEDAKDTMQIVYLKIFEGKPNYKEMSAFRTWLFSLIRFTAVDLFRKEKKAALRVVQIESPIAASHEENISRKETQQILNTALSKLSKKQQQILNLVFYHDFSLSKVALIMNISIGSVRTHYDRGKQQLREKLKQVKTNLL